MQFEWDLEKAAAKSRKHGVTFEGALTVFYEPLATTFSDPDHSESELRVITVGYSARSRLLVVCHSERMHTVRLIRARRATTPERRRHE